MSKQTVMPVMTIGLPLSIDRAGRAKKSMPKFFDQNPCAIVRKAFFSEGLIFFVLCMHFSKISTDPFNDRLERCA
jgi:hypothetical protein